MGRPIPRVVVASLAQWAFRVGPKNWQNLDSVTAKSSTVVTFRANLQAASKHQFIEYGNVDLLNIQQQNPPRY